MQFSKAIACLARLREGQNVVRVTKGTPTHCRVVYEHRLTGIVLFVYEWHPRSEYEAVWYEACYLILKQLPIERYYFRYVVEYRWSKEGD